MKDLINQFDTETTGIPDWKVPSIGKSQPHIVSLALRQVNKTTREVHKSMDVIIKPDGWSWGINDEAYDIHGISYDQAMDEGVPEPDAVYSFMEIVNDERSDYSVAHNNVFDIRMIRIALLRYFPHLAPDWKLKRRLCTMTNFRKLEEFHKVPKLTEAYEVVTGEEHTDAHSAMGDVLAMDKVYWHLFDTYGEEALRILGEL